MTSTITIDSLRKRIHAEFPRLPKPKYSILDNIKVSTPWHKSQLIETWSDWRGISNALVDEADAFFYFVPIEIAVYFIPRYMIYTLDFLEEVLPDSYDDTSATHLYIYLLRHQKSDFRFLKLTEAQLKLIKAFLTLLNQDEGFIEFRNVMPIKPWDKA